jgi:3-dehydrocarnitine:acetyl-CoA trimethylamine transferase
MRDRLPKNAAWSAFGIGRTEFPMAAVAVAAGGNVRVGLEDNLYLGRGQLAPSNAALVERAATIVELLDASVASPAEARKIFGLG